MPASTRTAPLREAMDTDVLVVGGGPGGCAAALQLAEHGVRTTLVDKATFPRDKVCGDALSGKVMRSLERLDAVLAARIKSHPETRPSWGVIFTAPGGRRLRVPFQRGLPQGEAPGAILPRQRFDHLLIQRVKELDRVKVLEGTAARTFTRDGTGWRVDLVVGGETTTITSRIIIAADGANSIFARHVAHLPMEPRHHAAGVRAYYSGVKGLDPDGFIELIFHKELLPGYLWIFPLTAGRANVGLGLRSDVVSRRRLDLKGELHRLLTTDPALKARFAAATIEGPVQGLGLPLASTRQPLSGDGYMLVGDAGHLIDPFTGEGISHAMISGMHAADMAAAALTAGRSDAAFLNEYDRRVWKRLGKELAISTRLQRLADRAWLFDLVVDRANRNPALADTISSMFTDLDLRARLRRPGFYMDLMLGRVRTT